MIGGANLPARYAPEWARETDEATGRTVYKLTGDAARSVHLYFTENAFVKGQDSILFMSERDAPGTENLFSMDLKTGWITRLTAYPAGARINGHTKSPGGETILYTVNNEVTLLKDGCARPIFHVDKGFRAARLSLTCDQKYVLIQVNEDAPPMGDNYVNFTSRMMRIKRSIIYIVPASGSDARVLVRDTAEGGHLQASPVNPHLFMFCHEGPWHLVNQRIYLGDIRTGEIWPCFRQSADDCVGHEFFTRSGRVFLDDRGPGHDGTITSSRAQAVTQAPDERAFQPFVAFADEAGEVTKRINMPYYLNHYHAGPNEDVLVGDGVDDLFKVDIASGIAQLTPLCRHATSWHGQYTHPHPTIDWQGERVLFASDRSGSTQLYMTAL